MSFLNGTINFGLTWFLLPYVLRTRLGGRVLTLGDTLSYDSARAVWSGVNGVIGYTGVNPFMYARDSRANFITYTARWQNIDTVRDSTKGK